MTVAYNSRSLPLAKNASNPTASAIKLAFDFTDIDSAHLSGKAWIWQGATQPVLVVSGTQTLTTINGEPGRVAGTSSLYDYTNATDYGLQVGAGDFTLAVRVSLPTTLPTTSANRELVRIGAGGTSALSVTLYENPNNGWYASFSGSTAAPLGATQGAITYGAGKELVIWVRRASGIVTTWTQDTAGSPVARNLAGSAATAALDNTNATRLLANFGGATPIAPALNGIVFWGSALSDADMNTAGRDFYNLQANSAVADSLAITSPAAGSTISTTSTISGTYVGTAPTGIEVQVGAGSWVAGTGMAIDTTAKTWSGTFVLTAGPANTLTAREASNTAVVSPSISNITVQVPPSSLAFTAPSTQQSVVSYRLFQADGSNQATVRISGTYVGSPTALEWRWNGGGWATLDAAPSGGVFDKTKTLQGLGQGAFEVRFANDPTVFAALDAVAVGDLWIVTGQSNHVGGGGGTYVPPVAPAAHPAWIAPIYDKTGRWRPNVETATDPFSKTTNANNFPAASASYSVEAQSATAYNTYFGKLATLLMAAGRPVAFVPCALGSTSQAQWAPSSSTNTLYGAAAARAAEVGAHKGVLHWQGEYDTGNGGLTQRSVFESGLNAIVNDWCGTKFPGTKFVLMNLNATGNSAGTGGTGPTDTGFNAIHAAIANVGATNQYVLAVADMNGTFSTSVHYQTSTEIDNIAGVAYTAMTAGSYATTAKIRLVDANGNVLAGLTGLKWAFFDQVMPSALSAPVAKGAEGATDASGYLNVSILGTTLAPGATGWFIVSDSDGTTTQSPPARAFCSPVAVT